MGIIIALLIGAWLITFQICSKKYKKLKAVKDYDLKTQYETLQSLQTHINERQETLQELQLRFDQAKANFDDLLAEQAQQKRQALEVIQGELDERTVQLNKVKNDYNTTCSSNSAIAAQLEARRKEMFEAEQALKKVQDELESMRKQHSIATKLIDYSQVGRILQHTEKDTALHRTLNTLKEQYPELRIAFSTVQWTHIWQTKFQAMTDDIQKRKVCGIYRIFTIDEGGNQRSYVGQAKDIRDRWSQHIKKMCGVLAADNQKFYSHVEPYNAHFEIIEECKESEFDAKEHYWISYYNGVSDGYNTKN